MKYQDIKDFSQRCEEHPDHQTGMISHAMIQMRLHEEIAELRHYIEWYLAPSHRTDFSKVRTITADGRCIGWDGHEVNMAPRNTDTATTCANSCAAIRNRGKHDKR